MDISIILPTYNEKDNIIDLVNQIIETNKNFTFEILIVDDDSPDGTYTICKNKFENNSNIKVLLRKKDRGLAKSIRTGIENSLGNHIVVMDTDLTHDPILIKEMISLSSQYDIISGSRYCVGGSMEDQLHSKLSYYYNIMLKFILKTQIEDNLGGFFCIKRSSMTQLSYDKIFYGYGEYFFRLLFFAKKKNFSILEIPAFYKKRIKGKSKSKFFYMFYKYCIEAVKLRIN